MSAIARVAVESTLPQLDRLFDYRIPEHLDADAQPGVRVRVPLRSAGRIASGYLVHREDGTDYSGELSELEEVVSTAPVLAPEVWLLARRVADRGAGSVSDVLRLAIPPRSVRAEKAWIAARAAPDADVRPHPRPAKAPESAPDDGLADALDAGARYALQPAAGVVACASAWVGRWALVLARLAARTLARGRSAIIAVPDYRDEDQVGAALLSLLPPGRICRLDARQSGPDRYRGFLACLGPDPVVVLGNRSAVYAPAADLGLIALWDDGDPLQAEPLAPYAHARDVALLRQEQQGSALVFASHSRSVEVQRLVELGWVRDWRGARAQRPRIILTARQPEAEAARGERIPSSAYQAVSQALAQGPALVQVARPGYAPVLACARCTGAARCAHCGGPLAVADAHAPAACRWCGALATGWRCPTCESTQLRLATRGSTRTAEELGRAFPGARVVVSDGGRAVQAVPAEPALVIATRGAEPIATGGYRAVLLLDGDRMLARESLRVADDCLRWWSNAAALAAPHAPVLLAGVAGPIADAFATWSQAGYAHRELVERRALKFPPAIRIASVTGTPDAVADALEPLQRVAVLDVLGPVDAGAGTVRSIVRFDYAAGPAVAAALRGAIVRAASGRRQPGGRRRAAPALRIRFDDPEPL